MRTFVARVRINAPYPIVSEHIIKTSSPAAAAGKAIRAAREKVEHKRKIESYSLDLRAVSTRM